MWPVTQDFHIGYMDFEALFNHNHALNEICLLEALYRLNNKD